jgi:hypothetical protein
MADPIITNGQTTLQFRPADFVVDSVPAWAKEQTPFQVGSRQATHTTGDGKKRVLGCAIDLERADRGVYAGYDSLYAFFEAADNTGVDGLARTFMLTDADGTAYQVRFLQPLVLPELIKDTQFSRTISLYNEHTLPTDEDNPAPAAWWAAYDMDANGGDLSAWTTSDPVTDAAAADWNNKISGAAALIQATGADQPLWKTGQINGRPAVDFISSDPLEADTIATGHFQNETDQPWSAYIVFEADSGSADDTIMACGDSTGNDQLVFLGQTATGGGGGGTDNYRALINDGASTSDVEGGTPDTDPHIAAIICAGTTISLWIDGTLIIDAQPFNTGNMNDLDAFRVGGEIIAGVGGRYWDGRIGEIVILPAIEHNTLQKRRQELRLADMWRLQLNG